MNPLEGAMLRPTKYLRFEQAPNPGRKTGIWDVVSQSSGDARRRFARYSPWRQYCFFPAAGTLYNTDCLAAITERIETCNRWQRNVRANLAAASEFVDGRRVVCWICKKRIEPDKAPRALCAHCATGGGLGPYT